MASPITRAATVPPTQSSMIPGKVSAMPARPADDARADAEGRHRWPCAATASADDTAGRAQRDPGDPGPAHVLRRLEQQADADRVEHEDERHQEGRQRVLPALQVVT